MKEVYSLLFLPDNTVLHSSCWVDGSQCIPKGDTVQVPGGRNAMKKCILALILASFFDLLLSCPFFKCCAMHHHLLFFISVFCFYCFQ